MQWPKVQLGTVVTILDSMRKPVKAGNRIEGPYPYYGANGQQGTINDFIFNEPLILVAEDGGHFFDPSRPIAYRIEGKTWVNNHAHVLRCNPDMDISYLCHQLARYNVQQYLTGSTRAKLTKGALERIPITKPPLEEQRRIAAILDKADEIEQTSGSVPQQIEMILRSEFDSQFGDPVLNQRSWDEVALESFLETIIDYRGKTPPKSDSGIPLLSAANITNHKIDLSHEQYISQEDYEKWTVRGFTQPGDVLITTEAPVGQVALYPEEGIYQISRRMMALRPDSDRADSVFLYFVLSHQNWQKRLTRILRGSTVPRVLKPDLLEQRVILPPIEIQRDFALFVNKMYSLNQLAEEKMESNTNLCNSMIQLLNPMT